MPEVQDYIIRLGLVILITGLIGFERERKHKAAGFSTHVLVAVGACGIALLQQILVYEAVNFVQVNEGVSINFDNQRLIAQVVTGIGFLGAGTILKTSGNITGLTTAASIWVCGMIGVIVGSGQIVLGLILGILTVLVLIVFKSFQHYHRQKRKLKKHLSGK